ncbi:glycosyl hydrolase family 28-related protein [Methanosarcina sp. Mfa9]|uniref:glycosyl hydrolase family 28-related protein n=1 Tax=Methanosarcina sp. Mfa9 TaxID=3439063 RepID=UPI003F84B6D2
MVESGGLKMQIKKNDDQGLRIISKLHIYTSSKKIYFVFILLVFLAGSLSGMEISGFFGTLDEPSPYTEEMATKILHAVGLDPSEVKIVLSNILHENYRLPVNYVNGLASSSEKITIDIKNNDFQKLAYKREVALAEGVLISSDDDYVPAKIHYNDQTVDVKLRLKGDWTDHLIGDKWSYRIEVKGDDTLFGMKIFSIQDPKTRNYLNEWVFQQALRREEIIAPRYSFIDVTINGKHEGIFALEEHFDKRIIEHSNYREGPIVRFNEAIFWENVLKGTEVSDGEIYFSSDIDAFQSSKIMEDPVKFEQFIKAKDLLESFRNGNLKTSEVFDIEKLARFFAISDLMGATHGTRWHNCRYYYNPITSKLEPIGFDSGAGFFNGLSCMDDSLYYDQYKKTLFEDAAFFEKYVQELERVSQKVYLDDLFNEQGNELQKNLNIIHRDNPFYYFPKDVFYKNQLQIDSILNPVKGLNAYFDKNTANGTIVLDVGNIQSMPLEILSVTCNGSTVFGPKEKTNILWGKSTSEPIQYQKIEFILPDGFIWSDQCAQDLKLNYKILGHSLLRNESVFQWSRISEDFSTIDLIRQVPNAEEFEFLVIDETKKTMILNSGAWELNRSLIIPEGYVVQCWAHQPTKLDLRNNATIISYSPIQLFGDANNPIIITSSDSTGKGIVVLNADEKSVLSKVVFSNLSAPSHAGWELSGAITFYNSDVDIDRCQFLDNKFGDDMLDLVRSEYTIKNTLFKNTFADALDDDFGKGTIYDSSFINCGNDALDFSGAHLYISRCFVNGTGDKGVSAGESSQLTIDQIEINNCDVAIASKDQSSVNLNDVKISSCNLGFVAYQKKPEFGPARIFVSSVDNDNVKILSIIEVDSSLVIDGNEVAGNYKHVYDTLYGESDTPNYSYYLKLV